VSLALGFVRDAFTSNEDASTDDEAIFSEQNVALTFVKASRPNAVATLVSDDAAFVSRRDAFTSVEDAFTNVAATFVFVRDAFSNPGVASTKPEDTRSDERAGSIKANAGSANPEDALSNLDVAFVLRTPPLPEDDERPPRRQEDAMPATGT
jgi:hypothetical protein